MGRVLPELANFASQYGVPTDIGTTLPRFSVFRVFVSAMSIALPSCLVDSWLLLLRLGALLTLLCPVLIIYRVLDHRDWQFPESPIIKLFTSLIKNCTYYVAVVHYMNTYYFCGQGGFITIMASTIPSIIVVCMFPSILSLPVANRLSASNP